MIFKTIDNELKVFNRTIISTRDNLKSLETVNATVYNKNGKFNLEGLSVNTSQSVSNFTKLGNAVKAYNGNLTKSTQLQTAYIKVVGNQNGALGNYLAGLNGAKASMGGYVKSLIGAKAASIGLQAASLALNAAISMGLSFAISALVSGISKWINKEKEAREQAIETANTAKEEVSNLTELLNKYNQLSEEIKTNTSAKDSLMSTQDELLKALGVEQSELDGLISKYGDLSTAINQVTLDALKDAQPDLLTGYNAYKEELLKEGGDGFWGGNNLINATGDDAVKAFKELQKAGIVDSGSYGTAGGVFALVGDDSTVEGILENYAKLKSAQEALAKTVEDGTFTKEELSENSLYNAIADKEKALRSYVDNYNSAIDDVNENSANQQIISDLMGKELPKTQEEFESFKQSLIDSAQASNNFIGSQEDIKDSVINALAEMPEFKQYFEDLAKVQDSTLNNETPTFSISDTITQLNTQLKPAFDSLKSAYQDIFTDDGFTLANVDLSMLDSIKSSIDSLNEMDGVEIDYSSFEELAKVLTDTSSTSDDVTDSINTLATDIVNSLNPALKDVTGENYQLVQQMLESLGVQNAEQVMLSSLGYTYEEYTAAKQECANAGFDLANATEEEIANFIAEQGGAENCGEALALLQLKKLLINTTRIDQTSDINNILTLAGAAGVASDSMVKLANAKTLLDTAVANNDSRGIAVAKQELIDAGKAAKDSVLDFKPVELNFSPASSTSSKGSGSKSEKDTYLEAYKKDVAELEHLRNMELITDKEFYDRLRDLNEKYFNDTAEHHEKYLDEYQSNEEKIFKGLKQVYQDSLEEHKSMMDSAASHAQRVLDKEIDKLKSASETTVKHYEQRIDAIDREIDAKQGIIDKYQDELDAMELANQKRKDAIDLQKAQYEVERAQNQRTIGQYQNRQKVYLTDGKAVRDAEDVRDESEYNTKRTEIQEKISLVQKEIDALEAKQDRLQAKIDQENQALDAQIEKLEAYKERWAEIAEKQTIAQEEAAFLAICGAEGEAEILAMREGILQGFSDNYDAITTNLADLAQANADRMAEIASQMESAASRAAKAASDMARAQANMSSSKGEKYASGTKSAKRGLNLVAEEKPEAVIDNDGVRLITKPTLLQMSGGEQVLNGKETETLLDGDTSLSPRVKELLSRSQIESIGNFANMNVMSSFQHNVKLPSFDFSKIQMREVAPTPVVQEINMTLPNVTNESGAQYIINTLNRLPLDTLQYSNRR